MKRMIVCMLLLALLPGYAYAEYWDDGDRRVVCCEDRPGCQVLQAVMMGSFAPFDPEDHLTVRIFSAALPRLTAVTEDDFAHFAGNFHAETDAVKKLYYIALGNCLRADIIISPLAENMDAQNARTVLNLFLNPVGETAEAQMHAIRENCLEEAMMILAENADVPVGFVEYLLWNPRTE